ncbi:SPFH domain-containing protein [Gottfriedia acidiceleris]|uniref:SPFH domain-containing protein n=1 Tax=Bacillaceae TaxID=186817 RepID=UPI001C3E9A84|nr:SPFH domain-containing protein [Bacillus sp. AFS001701]
MSDVSSMVGPIIIGIIVLFVVLLLLSSIRIVRQSEVYLVERLGKFHRKLESGIHVVMPFVERVASKKTLRETVVDFPPQSMITKDNVSIQVDSVVFYQVTDVVRHEYEIANPLSAISNLTATTLRNLIGELDLDETLTSRDTVNNKLRAILDQATDKWGMKVNRVEIRNIIPPIDIQNAMERQMQAERTRREKVLNAQGEKESKILKAEGEKQSKILEAEGERLSQVEKARGDKDSQVLRAEGEAEAIIKLAEAKSRGEQLVLDVWRNAEPTKEMVQLRSMEALEKVAYGHASKLVIPTDATKLLGMVESVKEVIKSDKTE